MDPIALALVHKRHAEHAQTQRLQFFCRWPT